MRFTFLNIPVYINPTFWIFIFLYSSYFIDFSIMHSVIAGVVVIMSLLVHEYGHALTARFFGANPSITLEAFGGHASYQGDRLTPKQHFIVTLNGPLLQSSLILISYLLLKDSFFQNEFVNFFLLVTFRLNILWCLLNLLPIYPLDGGQMASYFLHKKLGAHGYRASIILGVICAAVAVPYLYIQGYQFFSIFVAFLGFQNFQRLSQTPKITKAFHPYNQLNRGLEALKNNEIKLAKVLLASLLKCSDKQIRNTAVETLAEAFIKEDDQKSAYQLLLKTDHSKLRAGKILLCKLAFDLGNYELVVKYSRDIYEIEPSFSNAILNAKAFAKMKNSNLAGGWLETASGFADVKKEKIKDLVLEKEFDAVRDQTIFQAYTQKILP